MKSAALDSFSKRRSIYAFTGKSSLSDKDLESLIEQAILIAPSAFNSQSSRTVLLLGDNHKKLWNIVLEVLKPIAGAGFAQTEQKVKGSFLSGYGTILFFEDMDVVTSLMEKFPLYKDNFPLWSMQSSGMLQYLVWGLLAEAGMGASLQHYNPLIDERVSEAFGLPKSWKLMSQMPFGVAASPAGDKEQTPISKRFIVKK